MSAFVGEIQVGGMTVSNAQLLAEGGFGLVYTVSDRSGLEYVLKKCSIQRQEEFNIVQKEVQILEKLKECPYVVKIISSQVSVSKEGLILLEMCKGGHLLDRLNRTRSSGGYLDTRTTCQIFGQILSAVKVMHDMRPSITNRDLKLENVLFGGPDNNTVKLCDFGSCVFGPVPIRNQREKTDAEEAINKETTPAYRAPEMVDLYMRSELTFKTDIWALGCILYTLCYCVHPFQDGGSLATLNGITSFPSVPAVPQDIQVLVTRMCDIDPEARPTASQLIDAVAAVMQGGPLPAYSLSEEAQQLRRERQEQVARRAEKDAEVARKAALKGKNAILATKKQGQGKVVGGSVAAQRLARMRGAGGGNDGSAASFSAFDSEFDVGSGGDNSGGSGGDSGNGFSEFGESYTSAPPASEDMFASGDPFSGAGVSGAAASGDGDIHGMLGSPKGPQPGGDAMAAYFDQGGGGAFGEFDAPSAPAVDPFESQAGTSGGSNPSASSAIEDGFGSSVAGAGGGDPFSSNGGSAAFGGSAAAPLSTNVYSQSVGGGFSEFAGEPPAPTPSRPLSEAFGSVQTADSAANEAFQRPPSGAFSGVADSSAGAGFDTFSPGPSRPTSGAFDEFSSLPAAGQSFDDYDATNTSAISSSSSAAAAAFNSLPSAPATPHSSLKFQGSPIPVAQLVGRDSAASGGAPMASVVGKTEEVSVGGSEYIVDALHNMSFKGTPTKGSSSSLASAGGEGTLFDFSDDPTPVSDSWDASVAAGLGGAPSAPRAATSDPFGAEPDLLSMSTSTSTSTAAPAHSPGDMMDADLFGDAKPPGGKGSGPASNAGILSLYSQEQGPTSPSVPSSPAPASASQTTAAAQPVMLRPPPPQMPMASPGRGLYNPDRDPRAPMPLHTTAAFGVMNAPALGGHVALHTGRGSLGGPPRGGLDSLGGSWTDKVPQITPLGMPPPGTGTGTGTGTGMLGPGMRAPPSQAMAPPMGMGMGTGMGMGMGMTGGAAPGVQQQQQQQQQHSLFAAPAPGQEFANSTFGASLQPAGLSMNLDQSFDSSPLPSPAGSRPGSMGLRAPPPAQLTVTRGHVPAAPSAPPDPFGGLASFGGK